MSNFDINISGGATIRLLTAGKYCDKDIVITAENPGEGGVQLPPLDSAAKESDIVQGKQAIDGDGNVLVGTLYEQIPEFQGELIDMGDSYGVVPVATFDLDRDTVLREGTVSVVLHGYDLGDANILDVKAGKTFTSAAGVKVVGRYVPPNVDPLPSVSNPSSSADILENKEAIDGAGNLLTGTMPNIGGVNASLSIGGSYTIPEGYHDGTGVVQGAALPTLTNPAAAEDIVSGKEAIDANGNKVVGTVEEIDGQVIADEFGSFDYDGETFAAVGVFEKDRLVRGGSVVVCLVPPEWMGDATAEDVAAGKIFASAAGHHLVGTLSLEEEISQQKTMLTELSAILDTKAAGGGGGEDHLDATLDGTLTEVNSGVTKVIGFALRGITTLTAVNLPNATSIGTYAFYGCSGITSLSAPNVTSLGTYAFYGCKGLAEINFPKAATVPSTCFYQCTGLTKADFGAAKSIAGNAFAYCTKLQTLILRYTGGVVTLTSTTFSGAAFDGYAYVPAALLADYEASSSWSSYAPNATFRAIEDYPEITGGATA